MIYAFRNYRHSRMLTEFPSRQAMDAANVADSMPGEGDRYSPVSAAMAREHVKRGHIHETGLWLDGNRVRYARGE